ncbi:MAG: hypothetical protein R2712_04500 [Vicinamibacterales bacterium]
MLLAVVCAQVLRAAPATPVLFNPVVAGPRVTLSWTGVAGATGYRLGRPRPPPRDWPTSWGR